MPMGLGSHDYLHFYSFIKIDLNRFCGCSWNQLNHDPFSLHVLHLLLLLFFHPRPGNIFSILKLMDWSVKVVCDGATFFSFGKFIASLSWRFKSQRDAGCDVVAVYYIYLAFSLHRSIAAQTQTHNANGYNNNNNCVTYNSSFWRRAPDIYRLKVYEYVSHFRLVTSLTCLHNISFIRC